LETSKKEGEKRVEQQVNIFFVGTAGSGKTALTQAFHEWLKERGIDVVVVNLDPGVELLPYVPEIDVREWVNVGEVMKKYGVGPNGAQILSADLIAVKFREIKELLDGFKAQYVLFDTPGQMELFAFRQASKVVLETLGESNSVISFLFDSVLSSTPSGFVSLLLLSASIQFRFTTPFLNILSKADLLAEDKLEEAVEWSRDFSSLHGALLSEQHEMLNEANIEFSRALEALGTVSGVLPVSSKTYRGMEDVYNAVQQTFFAGEDATPD
jgi:GTPase SAR1 family protein